MSKTNNFLVQASILAVAGLLARVLGFLYRIPMQNLLGDAGTGVYGMAYAIYTLLLILSSAGLPTAISRMVSRRVALKQYGNARKVFEVAMILAAVSGFVGMLALYFGADIMADFLSSTHAVYSIQSLAPTVFIVALMSVFRGYFQGLGNSVPTALSQLVEQLMNAIFSVLLVYILIDNGIAIAAAGANLASGIGAVFGLMFIFGVFLLNKPRDKKRMRIYKANETKESSRRIAKELILTSIPIVAGAAVYATATLIDTSMVINILTNTGFSYMDAHELFGQLNGKYVVITTLPVAIATAITIAVIPSITGSVTLGHVEETKEKINLAFRATMLICVPAAVGIGVMAHPILLFLFPNNPDGGILLQVGAFSVIVLAITQVSTGILQGISVLKIPVISAVIGCIVKILLNFWLLPIPEINVVGAVISTTVCYVIAGGINTYMVCKKTGVQLDYGGLFIKPLASAIIMGLVCYIAFALMYMAFPSNGISLLFAIGLSVITYFASMIFLKGITKNELEMFPMGGKIMGLLDKMGVDYE